MSLRQAAPRSGWCHGVRLAAALAAALGAALALGACAEVDTRQRDICTAAVPALEPADSAITILKVAPDQSRAGNVRITYRSERPHESEGDEAGGASEPRLDALVGFVVCAFGGVGFEADKATLVGLETPEGRFSELKLHILNRYWLTDAIGIATAVRRLSWASEARPKGLMELPDAQAFLLQQFVNAGPPSALYGLLALAYSLVYGLVNRINLAFGDIAMIGAYGGLIGVALAVTLGAPGAALALPLAFLVATALTGLWGAVIGRTIFQPLLGRSSQPLLVATIGLSIALQEFVGRAQGVRERFLQPILNDPHLIAGGPFDVVVTTMQMIVVAVAAVLAALVIAGMRHSRFGRAWRAVADDQLMARMVGIDPSRVVAATFVVSSALAAVSGTIMTVHYGGTSFHMGTIIGLKALVAAIIGGIGSLPGAVVGGLAIGVFETMWSAFQTIDTRDVATLSLMAVFLVLKPDGLLGTRRALEEKTDRI